MQYASRMVGGLGLLYLLALPTHLSANNADYVIKVWGADERLTEGSVTDVAQTPEGFLWVGTVFGSVLRFDGTRFVSYNSANTPEFSLKWGVPRLMVDRTGMLWISMYDGGLTTWDKKGFRSVFASTNQPNRILWSAPDKVLFVYGEGRLLSGQRQGEGWDWQVVAPPNMIAQSQICADAQGRVWYVRADNVLGVWSATETNVVELPSTFEGQRVKVLASDVQGNVWLGTDRSVAEWKEGRFEEMTPTNGEAVLNVKRIVASGAGSLWIEANGRMRRCAGRQWLAESQGWNRELGRRTSLRFLHGDAKGGLWTSAGDLGLIHVQSDGTYHQLTTREGLPSNTVHFAFEDRDGDIWTGYERGGLVQVRPRLFRCIGREEGLSDSLVNAVCQDTQGAVWIGTHSGMVDRYEAGTCTNFILPATGRLQDSCVTSDAAGHVWAGAQGAGLCLWENGKMRTIATQNELQGFYPRLLVPARDGCLWVGTVWSIFCVSNRQLELKYTAPTVGDHPTALAEAADGTIWAGTLAGMLLRWDGKQFVPVEPPDRSALGRIWALWPSADAGLWAGTEEGGLLHWNNGKFHRFTTKDGLPSDSIVQALTDPAGNLWLGTRAGIARIFGGALARLERGELEELPVSVYGQPDGLLTIGSSFIYQPNCWRGRNGTLFFAMANSVAEVNPEDVHINPLPPTVALEELRADDRLAWPQRPGAVLTAPVAGREDLSDSSIPDLTVPPGRGDLEFLYTGFSLNSPMRVRFKYRLEGLESAWNEASGDRKATYRHIPPGRYLFHVMACNSDSIWSQDAALLAVTVQPHVYQTAWFRGGIGAAAAAGLCGAVVVTMRRRHRQRVFQMQRQHELERERTRIAQDLHDDLGAGLTEIGLLGGMLQNPMRFSEGKQEALGRIVQRCRELVVALDEIVWAVNPRNDSLNSLGGYLGRYAQGFLEPTSIRCRLEVQEADPDEPLNSEQRHHLFLAFKEALTNVVRHSGATEVIIKIVFEKNGYLLIQIHDNGRGLPPVTAEGSDGLINLRQRMNRIGGRCEITNEPASGVSVELSLPRRSNHDPCCNC